MKTTCFVQFRVVSWIVFVLGPPRLGEGDDAYEKNRLQKTGLMLVLATGIVATSASRPAGASQQTDVQVPSYPLTFGVFVARFDPGGTFKLEGDRWPTLAGTWKTKGDEIEVVNVRRPQGL